MNDTLYAMMNWPDIEGITCFDLAHPRSILGSHKTKEGILIQTFYPEAVKISLEREDKSLTPMEMADEAGFFAVLVPDKELFSHQYRVELADGSMLTVPELYDTELSYDRKKTAAFMEGTSSEAYELLGAHPKKVNGKDGVLFTVWAPNAWSAAVVGDFNSWDGRSHMMELDESTGIYGLFVPGVKAGELYKFKLRQKGGAVVMKSDPYARAYEPAPNFAGIVCAPAKTAKKKAGAAAIKASEPMLILEVLLSDYAGMNYREIAPLVIERAAKYHYTHVELSPVMEYPEDDTLGYQTLGYYAPTVRYGTPEDFKALIAECHSAGLSVILDFAPGHFPKHEHGLARFDGTCLYEHQDPRQGEHPEWNTLIYQFGRAEVASFLISAASFWVKEYQADGLKVDGLDAMLYLDYGKKPGEWLANVYGGNENLEAVSLIRSMNTALKKAAPATLLIAREPGGWPKVTDKPEDEGLGFDEKFNDSQIKDFLYFMECDPLFRKGRYQSLTYSMLYAYSEKYILNLSHEWNGPGTDGLQNRMPGETKEARLSNLRAAYAYLITSPGKKLFYPDRDIEEGSFLTDLFALYRKEPALYEQDHTASGFEWLNNISPNECIVSFVRRAADGSELVVIANFTPVAYNKKKMGVPHSGKYKEIFNSDAEAYGGLNVINRRVIASKAEACDGRTDSIRVNVPPMGVSILRYVPEA